MLSTPITMPLSNFIMFMAMGFSAGFMLGVGMLSILVVGKRGETTVSEQVNNRTPDALRGSGRPIKSKTGIKA